MLKEIQKGSGLKLFEEGFLFLKNFPIFLTVLRMMINVS
jgi:hypothetical protein